MTVQQFTLPFLPLFSSNGLPIPNGIVAFYENGSLTPTIVYADHALTIPLGNEIQANAVGRLAPAYLDDAALYRVRILDETRALLDEIDNYSPGTIYAQKGDPGSSISFTPGLFNDIAGQAITEDLIILSGDAAVGDSGAGNIMVYDAAVDAAYVAAHPTTARISLNGRGYKKVGVIPSGTMAEFDTAATDGNFSFQARAETLTNKLLSAIGYTSSIKDNSGGASRRIGTAGLPLVSKSALYVFDFDDMDCKVVSSAGGAQIPKYATKAFPPEAQLVFINTNAAAVQLTIDTDSLFLAGTALGGAGAAGDMTVGPNGIAVIEHISNTVWFVSGPGVTKT